MPLSINPDTVCFVIAKARELNVKVAPEELADDGDDMERILEDYGDDATYQELKAFLDAQSDDVVRELLALTWIGRGDYAADEWRSVMGEISDVREMHTTDYLLATPLLADYLEEGLAQFGQSCEDFGGKG
ncbi:MAG: DUF3775 domain-containing protein [Alphaproteobacteria bacterium]